MMMMMASPSFLSLILILILFLVSTLNLGLVVSSTLPFQNPQPHIPLRDFCGDLLPPGNGTSFPPAEASVQSFLVLNGGFFTGGFPAFRNHTESRQKLGFYTFPVANSVTHSQIGAKDGVFSVNGVLSLRQQLLLSGSSGGSAPRRTFHRIPNPRVIGNGLQGGGGAYFGLDMLRINVQGIWIPSTRNICMTGCVIRGWKDGAFTNPGMDHDCQIGIRIRYPKQVTIKSAFALGSIRSLRNDNSSSDPLFFNLIKFTAFLSRSSYTYTKSDDVPDQTCNGRILPLAIDPELSQLPLCSLPWPPLQILPFSSVANKSNSVTQTSIEAMDFACDEQNNRSHGFFRLKIPSTTENSVDNSEILVTEGNWNENQGQLCMTACKFRHSSLLDCEITVSFQRPSFSTLLFRYSIYGYIISRRTPEDPLYFRKLLIGSQNTRDNPYTGLLYKYTPSVLEHVDQKCTNAALSLENRKKKYPDGTIISDLGFDIELKDKQGKKSRGSAIPLFVNDMQGYSYQLQPFNGFPSSRVFSKTETSSKMNVSFTLLLDSSFGDTVLGRNSSSPLLSAEGIYYPKSGSLCMIACRTILPSPMESLEGENKDMDCRVLFKAQYPPSNPGFFDKKQLSGSIESLREKNDPLYFDPVVVSSTHRSVYRQQVLESILRMDLEVILSMVSLSLVAVFIVVQLFFVRSSPKSLRYHSFLMLTVLTLGYMIPLMLNFEAIFATKNRKAVMEWGGGWLEINEVVVRLLNMVVFLLLLRLLQLAWIEKNESGAESRIWSKEKKVFFVCLPIYLTGVLIASIVHWKTHSKHVSLEQFQKVMQPQQTWLSDMKAYGGLTLDFFLLPQVIGNCIWTAEERVLSVLFYFGITFVRTLPHIYDSIRAIKFTPQYSDGYYYANPEWDFYSSAWDILIPCLAFALAITIFLQERFRSLCLAIWFRRPAYEKVPTVSL